MRGMWGLLLLMVALLPVAASAQTPEKERRFVYGINLFDGVQYATGFVPPAVDTMYVLADHVGVLDPKLTEVYYWPITNDYRADFASLNQLVEGRLEVVRGGQVMQIVDLTEYVVQIDQAGTLGGGEVAVGDAARASWERFQTARAAYARGLHDYAEAQQAYQLKLDEVRAASANAPAGTNVVMPEPPAEPAPFTLYSTEVGRGFPILLSAGEYSVRVRDGAGQIVADSEKRLIAFGPRRLGVSFEVVSQERWTVPEQSGDPAEVIYTVAGGVTYLRAFHSQELNAEAFTRLKNPQDLSATPNRWQWVHVAPLPQTAALGLQGVGPERRVAVEDFVVEQVPGAALGYRVMPLSEVRAGDAQSARKPDLTAYRVEAPAGRATMGLRLLDPSGREISGSAREVVVVSSVPGWQLALPVLVPLVVGLSVILWRREQVQSARSLTAEQRSRMA